MSNYYPGLVGVTPEMMQQYGNPPAMVPGMPGVTEDMLRVPQQISQQAQIPVAQQQQRQRAPMNAMLRSMAPAMGMGALAGLGGTPGIVTAGVLGLLQGLLAHRQQKSGASGSSGAQQRTQSQQPSRIGAMLRTMAGTTPPFWGGR